MPEDIELPPIPLPRRLDRKMRLGPFPTARDAMKFAAYASVGAVVLPIGGALAWLPILGAGFLLSVVRPDGKALDERAGDWMRWQWRRRHPGAGTRSGERVSAADRVLRLPGPVTATILEAEGIPLRFLPPADARELFDRYRELLRTVEPGFHLDVSNRTLRTSRFRLPRGPDRTPTESVARAGYEEMTRLLLERRRLRCVEILLFEPGGDASALHRLDDRSRAFANGLRAMGVRSTRLAGSDLVRAAEAMGWSPRRLP